MPTLLRRHYAVTARATAPRAAAPVEATLFAAFEKAHTPLTRTAAVYRRTASQRRVTSRRIGRCRASCSGIAGRTGHGRYHVVPVAGSASRRAWRSRAAIAP